MQQLRIGDRHSLDGQSIRCWPFVFGLFVPLEMIPLLTITP